MVLIQKALVCHSGKEQHKHWDLGSVGHIVLGGDGEYVLGCLEKGVDWRKKAESMGLEIPEEARGLGVIEGNQSNLFGDRMKDRDMSWTIIGAMVKPLSWHSMDT